MRFLAALQFLTVIPLPKWREFSPEELGRSIGYFPLVGIVIGLILAGLNWLLSWLLPSAIVNALLITCLVVISGALHLDGFIDTCDGIAVHKTPEERWQIMHDSRAGSFGIVGVLLLLLVKYISLNNIPEPLVITALVLMPVMGRWAMVYAIFAYPYARPAGLGKVFKQVASWPSLVMATIITLVVAIGLAWLAGLVIMVVTWVIVIAVSAYLKRKFTGLTGDTYGAINELAEVGVLISVLLLARYEWLGLA